jgi:hypothetical protein
MDSNGLEPICGGGVQGLPQATCRALNSDAAPARAAFAFKRQARRTRTRLICRTAQLVVPYPDCKKGCGRSAVPIPQLILDQLTGTLDRELNPPCAPVKPSTV